MVKRLFAISVFISFFFLMLLSFPILGIFNVPKLLFGFPTLFIYLFFIWAALSGILAILTANREKSQP
jgi:hypothetical protein